MFQVSGNAPGNLQNPQPKKTGFQHYPSHQASDFLDEHIMLLLEKYRVAGLSAAVVKENKTIWSGSYGWFDMQNNIPMKEEHTIRIASISKSFACLAAMKLVEENLLDIDEDINKYLEHITTPIHHPQHPDTPVTARQLMNHTSAIADGNYIPFVVAARSEDPPPTLDDYFSKEGRFYESDIWADFEPGREFEYSNMATIVLGAVIESISGKTFAEYVEETILSPLNMNQSTFNFRDKARENSAVLYRFQNGASTSFTPTLLPSLPEWEHYLPGTHGGLYSPQGGMISNARELTNFVRLMINNGTCDHRKIFSPESIKKMHEISVKTDKGGPATFNGLYKKKGLGIHITDELLDGYTLYGHSGAAYGVITNTYYTRHQDTNFGIIVLINGANTSESGIRGPFSRLEEELVDLFYTHIIQEGYRCTFPSDSDKKTH